MAKGAKRRGREQAFQTLYALSFTPAGNLEELKTVFSSLPQPPERSAPEPEGFAWSLASGVWENEKELSGQINKFSRNWRPERIGKIEMILLQMAIYEIFWLRTPPPVAISETLDMANQFGVASAKNFINGILDAAIKSEDSQNLRTAQKR